MKGDSPRWWLNLPPCANCSKSRVLIDCSKRLPWEVSENPISP